MQSVPFFTDDIRIKPHTGRGLGVEFLEKEISLREFAAGQPISLFTMDNGEIACERQNGDFIVGPEVMS